MSDAKSSRSEQYIPDRGDFARMVLHPQTGREQGGERPVLVLSTRRFSAVTGYALVAPITRTTRNWPFEVPIELGLRVVGVVLTDQTRSVVLRQLCHASFLGTASSGLTETVLRRIATILENPA